MNLSEALACGITKEMYEQYCDEPLVDDVTVEEEAVVEEPVAEETVEETVEEQAAEEVVEETTEEESIVPAAVETAAASAALEFKNMRFAGKYLAEELNLKFTNTLDCLYKCLKAKNHKTHGYAVERLDDNRVFLTPIQK
jgi:hypothetical protein